MNYELTRKTELMKELFPTGLESTIIKQKDSEEN
jgi:hypothetical protein